jgi:hypothetical protein
MEVIHTQKSFWTVNEYSYTRLIEISDTEFTMLLVTSAAMILLNG